MNDEHDDERAAPRDQIGQPSPKYASDTIAETGDSDHSACDDRAYFSKFFKNGRFLGNDGNASGCVEKENQPKRPPLPGLEASESTKSCVARCAVSFSL